MKKLQQENIRISNMGQGKLRIVTHLDYSEEMHQKFLKVLREINL
jgi:threonine aldolase